jgi:hypothetical protein
VNFTKIANTFSGRAKTDSVYKRIQRFFKGFKIDSKIIAQFVLTLLPEGPYWLTMDRTNWKFGKIDINILTVGVIHKGIAFPVFWKMLDKRGNSNTEERIELIKKVIDFLGIENIAGLLADREFIGKKWFQFLRNQKLHFVIRVKENFTIPSAKKKNIKQLIQGQPEGCPIVLKNPYIVCGVSLFVSGMKVQGNQLIVVSDQAMAEPIKYYLKRWEIETLFACLKSRGFNFEETHLNKIERIDKLMALLTIVFCWVHIIGEWLHQKNPIKVKNHGRKAKSIFRYGLDFFQRVIFNLHSNLPLFKRLISFLSCT